MAAAGTTVECGQLSAYTAPDPIGPTPGSIAIGSLTPWEITPTATVSANAAATLPSIVNSGPTCLALELDSDDTVTAVDFAAEGDVTGGVDFDGGSGFYLFANRLIVPNFITDAYPGLAALFVTSYQAGTQLTVTFSVDVATGAFTGFDGKAKFCGKAGVTSGGDGNIGKARIPAAVLSPHDSNVLDDASGTRACAAVHSVGVIVPNSEGEIDVETDVVITVDAVGDDTAAPAPDTATVDTTDSEMDPEGSPLLLILLVATALLALARPRAVACSSAPQR